MKTFIDAIDFYTYEVNDWDSVKPIITDLLDTTDYKRNNLNGLAKFETDRGSERKYLPKIMEILSPVYQKFAADIGVTHLNIDDMWSVRYHQNDHHTVHTHGSCNWSATFYIDYDARVHTGTNFVTKIMDPQTNSSVIKTPAVDEGIIMFFPSNILHFTIPNESEKIRRVISLDCTTSKKITV